MEFVRCNRALLAHGPVWLFSSGPIGATAKKYDTPTDPKELGELRRAIRPWDHRVFFGAWDPSRLDRGRLGFAERMIAKVLPRGDFRDWVAIQAWATNIARALQNQPTAAH
jgi:menaquinone-dependent protoporphyrinogen oxidase